ncbi:MAG TPA: NAD+ synthase [Candidatus Dormibacteraeota bacterium]|nr:NAD+ synthase [Candidatus Dormibacteraeota bacterium]
MESDVPRALRIGLAQFDPTVGDLEGNANRMIEWIGRARERGCDLVVFPELAVTGYPPEDLVLKPSFVRDNIRQRDRITAHSRGLAVIGGFVDLDVDIYNAAFIAGDGELRGVYHKVYLPNYGVFDEKRYYRAGSEAPVFELDGVRLGVSICEDAWFPNGPIAEQAKQGAEVLVNINGSPFHAGKRRSREAMIATRAMDTRAFLAWVNTVGGQDELVFDGNSVVIHPEGSVIARAPSFAEDLLVADVDVGAVFGERLRDTRLRSESSADDHRIRPVALQSGSPTRARNEPPLLPNTEPLEDEAEVYAALVLGVQDYVRKSSPVHRVVIAVSGGIDSALASAIAVDALGPDAVIGVHMPSRHTSNDSVEDSELLARALGIRLETIVIEGIRKAYEEALAPLFAGTEPGTAEENVQARIRGNLVMAISNKFGGLVLTTGNKSEVATGYCTLYGDMAGGYNALKDTPKTLVYRLSRYRNGLGPSPVIPERILTKAPSAELRDDQKDEDSLPPYDLMDPILRGYVEDDRSFEELVAVGHDPAMVSRVIQLVDGSEYKRRQAAPGVKITPRAFGRDRRMPIVNRYRASGQNARPASGEVDVMSGPAMRRSSEEDSA